jgi:ABC-2 type transport system permease protein
VQDIDHPIAVGPISWIDIGRLHAVNNSDRLGVLRVRLVDELWGAQQATISTATDMTGGIIARFRTMDIARVSVLTGHVLGAVIKTGFAVVIVTSFVFLLGFRSDAGPFGWLGAIALLILTAFSLTWLTVGMGLAADSVETASNTPMFLMILPFISSAFVPTDAMPAGLRYFAEHQPFTPIIETLRALLTGAPTGSDLWLAIGWCALISVLAYLWSRRLFLRVPAK